MRCEVLFDWLTFTVKEDDPDVVIRDWLGMDPALFQLLGYGICGYQNCKSFSNIMVAFEARENSFFHDMGVCVSMSGNGCRSFETYSKLADGFSSLFQKIISVEGAHVTRLDVACDEREGALDMDTIIDRVQDNDINSRLKKRQVVYSYDGKSRNGATVYIGAPSSSFRLRIYDKALEQGVSGHWIRVEMVLRGNNANSFAEQISGGEKIGKLAAEVLNDKFAFINRDDTNISRCSVCDWWSAFVEEIGCVVLFSRKVVQHTVDRLTNWVNAQVGPTLSIIMQTLGFQAIREIALKSADRLNFKQEALVRDWLSVRDAMRDTFSDVLPPEPLSC